jgi:Tfp pilus assembly protein PilO
MIRGKKHTETGKALVLAGILFVTVVIGFVFVQGSLNKAGTLSEERDALSKELTRLTDTFVAVQQGNEVLESMRQDLAEYGPMIRREMNFTEFYQELSKWSADHDITISQLVPGDVEPLEGYSRLPISINGAATFTNLHQFLNSIGENSVSTSFEELELTPSSDAGLCEFDLNFYIFSADLEDFHVEAP